MHLCTGLQYSESGPALQLYEASFKVNGLGELRLACRLNAYEA
jgi:hypothetical protein